MSKKVILNSILKGAGMNEIVTSAENLPANLEDLSRFVLVGREKLNIVRAQIRAIKRVGLAREVAEQKRQEAQQLAEAVIDAEVRIGELMREIPTASGERTDIEPLYPGVKRLTKTEQLKEQGFNQKQTHQFEQMSKHPEAVAAAKAEAREAEEIVTRSAVLDKIKEENAALKRRVQELEQTQPQVVTQTVEVVPEDYKDAKTKAKVFDREVKRLNDKLTAAYKEREEQNKKIQSLQDEVIKYGAETQQGRYFRELESVATAFETQCEQFIRWVGGYIWITQNPGKLKPERRESVTNAVQMVYEWAGTMLHNLSVSEEDENEN